MLNPCYLNWDSLDQVAVADGLIATLTFDVADSVSPGESLAISCSYNQGDIYDTNLHDLTFEVVSGAVTIIDYIPGDANKDETVNGKDVTIIRRFNAGYDVEINELAANVNGDDVINGKDATLIRRYNAGYDVELLHAPVAHTHYMEATVSKSATCTEDGNIAYWQCTQCKKYYSDEAGKTEISLEDTIIPAGHKLTHVEAQAALPASKGWIEHWKCSVCGKYFANSDATQELTEDEVFIDPIAKTESTVVYNVYGSDPYLESVGVDNSKNPTVFYSEDGLVLNDLVAPDGYMFKGWTTAAGTPITEIAPSSSSRQIVLNAVWNKIEYTITFDSPDFSVDPVKYTTDTGATLKNPECYGYTFVGWSNNDGFLIKSIKPGTTGNIELHANWTSNRNRATSYSTYGKPIIIEDDKTGQFLFVYDIGRIDNVPLSVYSDENGNTIGANGTALNIDMTYEVKEEFSEVEAKEVIETVADATTRSSGWTLSKEWNELYEEGAEYKDKQVKTEERTDSQGNVVGGNYFVSNSQGGSSFISTESGGSTSNSSKVTTDKSTGINASYDKSTEKYCDGKLGITNETEVSAKLLNFL